MKKITKEEIDSIKTIDISIDDNYAYLYSLYHLLVTKYLSEIINIKEYDNYFENSSLNYLSVNEDNMDCFQYLSSSELKYLYLRNYVHIERLNEKEREFLNDKLMNENEELNQETIKFLETTMPKILSEKTDEKDVYVSYGPNSPRFAAPSNALVIGFRYDEYNYNGMSDDEWDINHEKQISDISHEFALLEWHMEKFKLMPFAVIEYDSSSINKRNGIVGRQL